MRPMGYQPLKSLKPRSCSTRECFMSCLLSIAVVVTFMMSCSTVGVGNSINEGSTSEFTLIGLLMPTISSILHYDLMPSIKIRVGIYFSLDLGRCSHQNGIWQCWLEYELYRLIPAPISTTTRPKYPMTTNDWSFTTPWDPI